MQVPVEFGGNLLTGTVYVTDRVDREMAEREFQALDFSQISFPSDRISIRSLRTLHPQWFDHGFYLFDADESQLTQPQYFLREDMPGLATDDVGVMLLRERLIATCAYADAKGLPRPWQWKIEEEKQELLDSYITHGLASGGPHQAQELIRQIERAGTGLAQSQGR
jgi:hypothetical protein